MGSRARCRWGDIVQTLAWGVGRMEDQLPDGTLHSHWQGLQSRSSPGLPPRSSRCRPVALRAVVPTRAKRKPRCVRHPASGITPWCFWNTLLAELSALLLRDAGATQVNPAGGRAGGPGDQLAPQTRCVSLCPKLPGASTPGAPWKGDCRTRRETHTRERAHS